MPHPLTRNPIKAFFLDLLLLMCLPGNSWPMIEDQRRREKLAAKNHQQGE